MSLDCVAIGDTIAVGLGAALKCEVRAAASLTSSRVINVAPGVYHEICVISAGTYDPAGIPDKLNDNLWSIRKQSNCKIYVWVKPVNTISANEVSSIAQENHDVTVSITPGTDGETPLSYGDLASSVINSTNN